MECFKCGVSGSRVRLFDVISDRGIVKICEKCFSEEDMPIVRKPSSFQLWETKNKLPSSRQTVYERLSHMSGIKKADNISERNRELLDKQETTLKDIIDKNLERSSWKIVPKDDLVDNFHWIIMRARRLKHLTQSQFARAIAEPEATIKILEEGVLVEGSYKVINKIENYLGIKLVKKEAVGKVREFDKKIDFDPITAKTLTISDLKEMKQKKEGEIFKKPERKIEEDESIENQNKDLSKEEIDEIIFRGK